MGQWQGVSGAIWEWSISLSILSINSEGPTRLKVFMRISSRISLVREIFKSTPFTVHYNQQFIESVGNNIGCCVLLLRLLWLFAFATAVRGARRICKYGVVIGFFSRRTLVLELLDGPLGWFGSGAPFIVLPQVVPIGREFIRRVCGIMGPGFCKYLGLVSGFWCSKVFFPQPDGFGIVRVGIKVPHQLKDVVRRKGTNAGELQQSFLDVLSVVVARSARCRS